MIRTISRETIERNKAFLQRKMTGGILLTVSLDNKPIQVDPETAAEGTSVSGQSAEHDVEFGCLSLTRREWIIEQARKSLEKTALIEDDSIPRSYPTLHFGESLYSGMLGGDIKFYGNRFHSYSYGKPLIKNAGDLIGLRIDEHNSWVNAFEASAAYFAEQAAGAFCLQYLITVDALNLAVELMGSTEAYICALTESETIHQIMEFGVDYNAWFYQLQKAVYEKNNRQALMDPELYALYDKPVYSIDAYTLCNPKLYDTMGFTYQQRLIEKCGGGMMHTHGTGLAELCPKVVKLQGLSCLQIGRDLKAGEYLEVEQLNFFRKITGDLPLVFSLSPEEFENGIRKNILPGGVKYETCTDTVDEANRLARMARNYRAPPCV